LYAVHSSLQLKIQKCQNSWNSSEYVIITAL
jgi:hypothetical protein